MVEIDETSGAALIRAGHEVLLIPTYTPLRTDDVDVSMRRVFFGGINVYLQQKWPIRYRMQNRHLTSRIPSTRG